MAGKGWIGHSEDDGNGSNLTGMGQQIMNLEADLSIANNAVVPWRAEKLYFLPVIDYQESILQPKIAHNY